MKRTRFIYATMIAVLLLLNSYQAMAQKFQLFSDFTHKKVYRFGSGDTLLIKGDTVILMNKPTFNIYDQFYKHGQSAATSYKSISDSYENIIRKQDTLIATKEAYYQSVKKTLDSVIITSTIFAEKSNNDLTQVKTSLSHASAQLTDTQKLLDNAQKLIADERKRQFANTLKFGLGGLVIGALGALIIRH